MYGASRKGYNVINFLKNMSVLGVIGMNISLSTRPQVKMFSTPTLTFLTISHTTRISLQFYFDHESELPLMTRTNCKHI